jgi:hypothetical protein
MVYRVIKTRAVVEGTDDCDEVIVYDGTPSDWIEPLRDETASDVVTNSLTFSGTVCQQHKQDNKREETSPKQNKLKFVPTW